MKSIISRLSIILIALMLGISTAASAKDKKDCCGKKGKCENCMKTGKAPGPVTAVSSSVQQLPNAVKLWLDSNFKGVGVNEVKFHTLTGIYDIELVNDYDISINASGKVMELEAPDNQFLPPALLVKTIPATAYNHLKEKGLASHIEEVRIAKNGTYIVKSNKKGIGQRHRTLIFDANGAKIDMPQKTKKAHKKSRN